MHALKLLNVTCDLIESTINNTPHIRLDKLVCSVPTDPVYIVGVPFIFRIIVVILRWQVEVLTQRFHHLCKEKGGHVILTCVWVWGHVGVMWFQHVSRYGDVMWFKHMSGYGSVMWFKHVSTVKVWECHVI